MDTETNMAPARDPKVLVVDDDPQILVLFEKFLEEAYEVDAVQSGSEALESISDDIDVVLLDRRMPGMKGSEVLAAIRERGHDCRVAMITAVDPDVDIIDMGFDDYLVKPVTKPQLRNMIDSLLRWDDYDAVLREYFEVARKVALLEENTTLKNLDSNEDYQALTERLSTLKSEADDVLGEIEDGDFPTMTEVTLDDRPDQDESDTIRYSS